MDETKSDETNYFGSVEDEFRFGVWKSQKFYALSNFVANFELEVNSDSGVLSGCFQYYFSQWTSFGVSHACTSNINHENGVELSIIIIKVLICTVHAGQVSMKTIIHHWHCLKIIIHKVFYCHHRCHARHFIGEELIISNW